MPAPRLPYSAGSKPTTANPDLCAADTGTEARQPAPRAGTRGLGAPWLRRRERGGRDSWVLTFTSVS